MGENEEEKKKLPILTRLKLAESKREAICRSLHQINEMASSVGLQWKDLEERLDSRANEIEARLEELETRENELEVWESLLEEREDRLKLMEWKLGVRNKELEAKEERFKAKERDFEDKVEIFKLKETAFQCKCREVESREAELIGLKLSMNQKLGLQFGGK